MYGDFMKRVQSYVADFFSQQYDVYKDISGTHTSTYKYLKAMVKSSESTAAYQITLSMVFIALPIIIGVATPMITTGAILSTYIPLVPFMIFTFGVISWFISVIEAMTAAPLVALGMTHPEGHDLMGKSEQAVMLLLSVFIRPICMIIGLVCGIVLLYVGYNLLNVGLGHLATFVSPNGPSNAVMGFLVILFQTFILVSMVNQCFGMIYNIPDKVMVWIGLHAQGSDIPHLLDSVKQGVQPFVQEGAQGLGQSMSSSKGALESAGSSVSNELNSTATANKDEVGFYEGIARDSVMTGAMLLGK
jgi:defect-in-organelle-trafficking protein DotA